MREPEVWAAVTAAGIRAAEEPVLAELGDDVLMDRAADAVEAEARTMLGARGALEDARVAILAGTGKNGGDALLAGARLARDGIEVTAILTGATAHARGLAEAESAGTRVVEATDDEGALAAIEEADLIIDGIVGLGASLGLRDRPARLVDAIPDSTPVLAVDLPSGLDPDWPSATLPHVRASVTVTFTAPKPCLLLPPAALDAGRVVVADVGIPVPEAPADAVRRLTATGAATRWPVPGTSDHKYSRGVVGVIAGSERYPGAAVLTCSAVVRSGAGMVRYVGPRRVQDLVLGERPEVVVSEPPVEGDVAVGDESLPRVDAWVIGPGVGDDLDQLGAAEAVLATEVPAVIDADAILWYAERCARGAARARGPVLLTPHGGELTRALAALGVGVIGGETDAVTCARTLGAATGATVLLKGAVTLVASPEGALWSQADGSPWLATAGAGDVLAGILGTLLAAGLPADEAGALGALVHGRAATLASGGGPLAALDVADALPATVDALRPAIASVLEGR